MLTVLIAEDDPEMRRVLKKVAEKNHNLRVMGEAGDGNEAFKLYQSLRPDIVFVDIDLPGQDGVTLARRIFALDPHIRLVFITAYDQYREEAFDVYACDYLVKPFKIDRLRQTLDRLCLASIRHKTSAGESSFEKGPAESVRVFRNGSRTVIQKLNDILFITREGRRTVVYHVNGCFETNESLDTLELELGGYPFLRTHKGFIVNLEMIREVIPVSRWTYQIVMAHTTERPLMTRNKYYVVKQMLGIK